MIAKSLHFRDCLPYSNIAFLKQFGKRYIVASLFIFRLLVMALITSYLSVRCEFLLAFRAGK